MLKKLYHSFVTTAKLSLWAKKERKGQHLSGGVLPSVIMRMPNPEGTQNRHTRGLGVRIAEKFLSFIHIDLRIIPNTVPSNAGGKHTLQTCKGRKTLVGAEEQMVMLGKYIKNKTAFYVTLIETWSFTIKISIIMTIVKEI